jgi:hypothetical protein
MPRSNYNEPFFTPNAVSTVHRSQWAHLEIPIVDTFGRAVEWQLLQPTPLHAAFNAYMTTHQWSTTKANISLYLGLLNAQQGAGLMSLSFSRLVKGNRTERIPFQMATASPCTRLSLSLEFASSDDSGLYPPFLLIPLPSIKAYVDWRDRYRVKWTH